MEKMTTPVCSGVSSVILPKCALTIWLPYKKGISPLGLIQILCCNHLKKFQLEKIIHRSRPFRKKKGGIYLCILCQVIKSGNVKCKFTCLCEFTETYTHGTKLITSNTDCHAHHRFTNQK